MIEFTQDDIEFLEYSKNVYLGSIQTMPDESWDLKRKSFEDIHGSIFKYMDFGAAKVKIKHEDSAKFDLNKIKIKGKFGEEMKRVFEVSDHDSSWFLKYDGCSIISYYNPYSGNLIRIATKSEEDFGIDKTTDLINKVPNIVPKGISSIQMEALVPLCKAKGAYEARAKANGLINSEYLQTQVDSHICLRAFKINGEGIDVRKSLELLKSLPVIYNNEGLPVFSRAEPILDSKEIPMSGIVFKESWSGLEFVFDGLVNYNSNTNIIKGYKMYSSEVLITKVTNIEYNKSSKLSYVPKIIYDSVVFSAIYDLNGKVVGGKTNDRCASNGIPEMMKIKCGIGAVIAVTMSGNTIPQIVEVIEESTNYNFPKCSCGHQFSEEDLISSSLKCSNLFCTERINEIKLRFNNKINSEYSGDWEDWADSDPANMLNTLLNIDRMNIETALYNRTDVPWGDMTSSCYLLLSGGEEGISKVKEFLMKYISFSELASKIYNLNAHAVQQILN